VAKGTLVATDNGIVPVENISVGDKIQTTLGFDEVREIKTYSNQDIYRVHFSDGFSQDVTKGHIFHTMISGIDSRKRWNNEKRLLDIDDNYFVRKEWYKKYPNLNTKLSRDDGLLVGLYLGDGCYSNNSSFNISTNSKEDNSYIEELFIRVGGKFRIDKSEGNCVRYYLTHNKQYLDNLLETVGINTNGKQIFFEKSLNTNKNFILGLIDGLISSDGNVNNTGNYPQIRFSNTNFDIHTLLKHLMLFIKADYKVYKRKIHHRSEINGRFIKAKKTIYTGVIDNDSILNLYNELKYISHKEKNEKLKKVIKNSQLNGVRWKTQIKNIEYIGKGEVFDLYEPEADDWNHCGYVSRGCGEVVANTGLVEYNGETIETGDVCNLGSLVLPRYYDMETKKFDYDLFREDAFLMTEALDNIIDISDYPIEMYRQAAKLKRKIGVGIVGAGSLLMMMGIKYGSDESVKLFDKILSVFMNSLYQKSALLAKEKGPFALYSEELLNTGYVKNSKVLTEETIDLIRKYGIRNSALSAIAPTGTLSILAGNMSGGLEPVFSTEFTRWNRVEGKKVDFQYPAIHKGEWFETDYFKKEIIADEEILLSTDGKYRIDKNQGLCKRVTIRDFGYNEALKNDISITPTATELSVQEHLNILGVFAKNIDLSCSKCVELNTRINTSDGTMKLRDISDNRKEDTFEHVSNIEVSSIDSNVKNINSFYYNGFVEGKKITTDAGIDLNGSNQHNIIVLNEKHELCWKSLDKLSVGDIVPIKLKSDISSNKTISKIIGTSFNKPTNCKPITIPTQLTTDLMWWLGCVYADGNVNDIGVHLTQVGGEVLDKYIEVSKKLFDWQPTIVKDNRRKNLFKISINSKVLSCWMKYINFSKNIISEIVFSAPHLLKKKFVEGITLDGYVTEQVICLKTDKSEDLIKDLQLLCINIGIPTYISSKFNKEYNKYYYNLFVGNKGVNAMANFIFPENYKNEKFMKLYNSKPYNSGSCFGSYGLRIPIDSNFLNKIEDIHKKVTTSTTLYNIFHKILNDARKYKSLTLGQIQTVYSFGGEIPDIFNKSNILFTFIKSIDNTYIETADISVEDTHNYIANGFMSHNTINLPADIPFEAFKNLYGTIHNYGVKGCTTYREGTSVSVLESKREEKDKEIKEQHEEFLDAFKGHENGDIMDEIVKLPEEYPAKGYVIRAQSAKWYLHVAFKDEAKTKPFAIFVNTNNPSPTAITMDAIEKMKELAKSKGLGNGKLEEAERKFAGQKNSVKIARMLGYLFRHNVPMIDIIMALDKVEDAHPGTFVFRIKKFLTQFVIDPVDDLGFVCEQCGSKDIVLQEGCTLCRSCGSSKCS
jgi:ribonucleotide reductase alpha subunit